jgi:hypothetical protein
VWCVANPRWCTVQWAVERSLPTVSVSQVCYMGVCLARTISYQPVATKDTKSICPPPKSNNGATILQCAGTHGTAAYVHISTF